MWNAKIPTQPPYAVQGTCASNRGWDRVTNDARRRRKVFFNKDKLHQILSSKMTLLIIKRGNKMQFNAVLLDLPPAFVSLVTANKCVCVGGGVGGGMMVSVQVVRLSIFLSYPPWTSRPCAATRVSSPSGGWWLVRLCFGSALCQ